MLFLESDRCNLMDTIYVIVDIAKKPFVELK